VLDAALFDALFADLVIANAEGRIVASDASSGSGPGQAPGIPFTAASVDRYSLREPMQPAGAALLRTAWQHRALLLAG
jgi:hypothetical protein